MFRDACQVEPCMVSSHWRSEAASRPLPASIVNLRCVAEYLCILTPQNTKHADYQKHFLLRAPKVYYHRVIKYG